MRIRRGAAVDAGTVLALFDEAVEWLVARGQTGQWGSEPFSAGEKRVAVAAEWASGGGLRVAEDEDGEAVGAIVLGARPAWVSPRRRPSSTSRRSSAHGAMPARTSAAS